MLAVHSSRSLYLLLLEKELKRRQNQSLSKGKPISKADIKLKDQLFLISSIYLRAYHVNLQLRNSTNYQHVKYMTSRKHKHLALIPEAIMFWRCSVGDPQSISQGGEQRLLENKKSSINSFVQLLFLIDLQKVTGTTLQELYLGKKNHINQSSTMLK